MKICSNCGASNADSQLICSDCGAMLPESKSGRKGGSVKIPQPVLIAILVVVAVGLIAGGIFWAISNRHSDLENAWSHTVREFVGKEESYTQFRQFLEIANDLLKQGDYSTSAAYHGGMDLKIDAHFAAGKQLMRGDLMLGDFGLEFSAHQKVMQFRFPGEYEIYGFNVEDLNKILESFNDALSMPLLKNLLPAALPTDLELDLFARNGLTDVLENLAGEEYRAFKESLVIEEWNDEAVTIGGRSRNCDVYKISWKSESASRLLGALGSGGFLPNVGGLVNVFLPEMDPYVYCYIDGEYLVGVRFTAAGSKCFLVLEGEKNLWDSFTLTAEAVSGEVKVYTGTTERSDADIVLRLQDGGQTLLQVNYNDDNGSFRVETKSGGTLLDGQVTVRDQEAEIRLNWTLAETGAQSVRWSIAPLKEQPAQLGENYSNLGNAAWSVIENIIIDFVTNR